MALSGSLNTTKYDGRYYTLSWTATQSPTNNKSTVKWTLKAVGGNSSWYAERTVKVVIDGVTVFSKTNSVNRYTGTVASGSIVLTHDSSGNKSFTAAVEAAVYTVAISCTGSKSFTLNTIPRKATVTAAPNFTDEANPTLSYSNLAGNSVTSLKACISLTGAADDIAYRDIPKTGNSYTFNLTAAERAVLRNATKNGNSRAVRFYVQTVIGGVTYLDYLERTLTIVNAAPTLAPVAYDIDAGTLALTGDRTKVIKYYSNINFESGAAFKKSATAKSYRVTCGSMSSTTAAGTFYNVEAGTVNFSVTDSRGNTATGKVALSLINYVKLSCSLSVTAPTTAGDMSFTVRGNYYNGSFGATNNALALSYRIKVNSEAYGDWVAITPTLKGNTYTVTVNLTGLNYLDSYTVEVKAVDKLATVTPAAKTVKSTPVFDWSKDDFNLNALLKLFNNTVLRRNGENGNIVLSGSGTDVFIRPNGTGNAEAQSIFGADGSITLNGRSFAKNNVLWSGAVFMTGAQTINLTAAISAQVSGIVLVFSRYSNNAAENSNFNFFFVPKYQIAVHSGAGCCFQMNTINFGIMSAKYLYINDTTISGNDLNTAAGTGASGIAYDNSAYALRYVIGV